MPAEDWARFLAELDGGAAAAADGGAARLRRALALGHDVAPGTLGVSVTQVRGNGYRTPAASVDLALQLDEAQYADGAGPCLIAARDRDPQRIDAMAAETRFPRFVAAAGRHGVRSSLSLPIVGANPRMALNLYSGAEAAFGAPLARHRADLLARLVSGVAQPDPAAPHSPALAQARESGEQVRAATDLLMRRHDLDEAQAFSRMIERSRVEQAAMRTVAEQILGTGGATA